VFDATIHIMCDGCDKEYEILVRDRRWKYASRYILERWRCDNTYNV
jgi:hypothetical protein